MTTACPVMNDAVSEERNRTSCAISEGSLMRPIGIIDIGEGRHKLEFM
jgi:hypothetical protein